MNYLDTFTVISDEPNYSKYLEDNGFTPGQTYVSVGMVKMNGRIPPAILLINRYGIIKTLLYTEDKFIINTLEESNDA